jgi:hypothetical protein
MRAIAIRALEVPAEGFSMSTMTEAQWEQVHGLVLGFARPAGDGPEEPADLFGDAPPARPGDLVGQIREAAASSGLSGGPTDPQKARLKAAFGVGSDAGLATEAIAAGVRAALGRERIETAAEAQAVITAADSLGDERFRAEWAGLAG